MNYIQGKNRSILKFLLVSILVILSACNAPDEKAKQETDVIVEREQLEVNISSMEFDKDEQELSLEFTTNILDDTYSSIRLINPNGFTIGRDTIIIGFNERNIARFFIDGNYFPDLIDGLYQLELVFNVNKDNDENTHFLDDTNVGEWHGDNLSDRHKDSDSVTVEVERYNKFSVSVKTESMFESPFSKEEKVDTEKERLQEDELTQGFLEYNRKYYKAFKNSLDLIGSNFELIYDGYSSPDLIDDLIMYSNEFNELLDVYEQNAIPVNDVDKSLYSITNEMITEQRKANEYIIKGLENSDDHSLVISGEYLKSVTNLYLDGHALIK
jgi:hypothetical protein